MDTTGIRVRSRASGIRVRTRAPQFSIPTQGWYIKARHTSTGLIMHVNGTIRAQCSSAAQVLFFADNPNYEILVIEPSTNTPYVPSNTH